MEYYYLPKSTATESSHTTQQKSDSGRLRRHHVFAKFGEPNSHEPRNSHSGRGTPTLPTPPQPENEGVVKFKSHQETYPLSRTRLISIRK
jgi:hypothetical protein